MQNEGLPMLPNVFHSNTVEQGRGQSGLSMLEIKRERERERERIVSMLNESLGVQQRSRRRR
jgi:hypothetical protein